MSNSADGNKKVKTEQPGSCTRVGIPFKKVPTSATSIRLDLGTGLLLVLGIRNWGITVLVGCCSLTQKSC